VSRNRERRFWPYAAVPVMIVFSAEALFACAASPPPEVAIPQNSFVGTWATAENDRIMIRPDTVVQHQASGQDTALGSQTCNGSFSFGYAVRNREALAELLPRQPNLDKNLSTVLVAPTYPVALLRCGQGDHTYVLLNDHELVAIYRDGDTGVVERLARR